jgi:MFS family permease
MIGKSRALLALALGSALFGSTAPSPLYGLYQSRWQFSSTTLTALFSVYAAGVLLSLLTMGRLSDRQADRRTVIVPALLVVVSGSLVFACATSLASLFVGRLLTGLGSGALSGVCTAALADLDAASAGKPRAAVIATLAFTSGAALGPLVTSAALQANSWPASLPFVLDGIVALAAIAGLLRLRWPVPPAMQQATPLIADGSWWQQSRPLRWQFTLACGIVVAAWAVASAFMAFGPSLVREVRPETDDGIPGLIAVLFQAVAGGSQLLSQHFTRRQAVQTGLALLSVSWAGSIFALQSESIWMLMFATIVGGAGYGASFVGSSSTITEIAPASRRAQMASMYLVAGYAGTAMSTIGLGMLIDAFGLRAALSVSGIVLVASVSLILLSTQQRAN